MRDDFFNSAESTNVGMNSLYPWETIFKHHWKMSFNSLKANHKYPIDIAPLPISIEPHQFIGSHPKNLDLKSTRMSKNGLGKVFKCKKFS